MRFGPVCCLVVSALLLGTEAEQAAASFTGEPPLRLSESVEAIVRDLEDYIPDYMEQQSIPGVAVALIRDSRIAWASGFGITNTMAWKPVTVDTLFEAASNCLLFQVGRIVILRMLSNRPKSQIALTTIWSLLVLTGLGLWAFGIRNLPVPKWTPVPAGAASSVRATAIDMATFLIEISNPRFLDEETAQQLQTPQVPLDRELSWGLGPGIQHSQQGDALWQWGQHIDFQSVMIIYPDQGFGVVVLTNSDLLNPDVAINIAHRAIGGKIDHIRRGSHLEFDYRKNQ
jgi:CubicO group peptidase (beta-lactamase class C family)